MPRKSIGRFSGRSKKYTMPVAPFPPAGRPTDYDPSYCDLMVASMRQGLSVHGFAGIVGVSQRTIYNWIDRHPEFAAAAQIGQAVRTAAYEGKAWDVANGTGGPGASTMIQFMLRNIAPEHYADTQHHRHAGPNGGPIQTVDLTSATDEQLSALAALFGPLAAAGGDDGADKG